MVIGYKLITCLYFHADFPEVLPSPPSSSSEEMLLGPTNFLVSTDNVEGSGAFYTFNTGTNFNDFDATRIICNDISKESVVMNSQKLSKVNCNDSVVVGMQQEASGGGQQKEHHSRDCEPMFYVPEIVDGKEVVTITTSCLMPTHNASPTSRSRMGINCDLATYVENTNCVPEDAMNKANTNTPKYNIGGVGVPVSIQEKLLLTPENFMATLSRSSTGTSLVDLEMAPELPTRLETSTDTGIKENMRKSRCTPLQEDVRNLPPKTVQTSSEATEVKNASTKVLITPDKFAHAAYSLRDVTKEEGGRSGVVRSLYSYYSNNGTESEPLSESDEELEELEEEDERKEEERQSQQQAAAMYDTGRLPPIGVFWDIENCQVCLK